MKAEGYNRKKTLLFKDQIRIAKRSYKKKGVDDVEKVKSRV